MERLRVKAEELEVGGQCYRVISIEDLLTAKELRAIAAKRQRK